MVDSTAQYDGALPIEDAGPRVEDEHALLLTRVKPKWLVVVVGIVMACGAVGLVGFLVADLVWELLSPSSEPTGFERLSILCGVLTMGVAVLYGAGAFIGQLVTDARVAALFGREEVVRWLTARTSRHNLDTRLRVRLLGGTVPRRRAQDPALRSRAVLGWPAVAAAVSVVWIVLYAVPTVFALGELNGVDLNAPLPQEVWSDVYQAVRLVASSVLAVLLWVGVRRWRGLTWTQVGVPYQRWLRYRPRSVASRAPRTELSKTRLRLSIATGAAFFGAEVLAGIARSVVGGMSPENSIRAGTFWVEVIQCVRAGIFEELGLIAIPAALVLYRTTVDRPTKPWLYVCLVVGSGIARAVPHMYYGPGAFVWAFTWGALVMAAYLRWRRILPLIVAHACFDLMVVLVGTSQ